MKKPLRIILPVHAYKPLNICNPQLRETTIELIHYGAQSVEVTAKLDKDERVILDLQQIKEAGKFFEEILKSK